MKLCPVCGLPLAMGIMERQDATVAALTSDKLWPHRLAGPDILAESNRRALATSKRSRRSGGKTLMTGLGFSGKTHSLTFPIGRTLPRSVGGSSKFQEVSVHPTDGYLPKKIEKDSDPSVVRDDVPVGHQKAGGEIETIGEASAAQHRTE